VSGSGGGGGSGASGIASANFSIGATSVTITHNFGTLSYAVYCTDNAGNSYAGNAVNGTNSVTITFGGATAVAGQCTAVGGTGFAGSFNVTSLPASPSTGTLAVAIDANPNCTTGGGSGTPAICRYSGSAWQTISGGGGGGGLADPGSNGIIKRTALNTTAPAVAGTDYQVPLNISLNGDGTNTATKSVTWASAYKPTFNGGATTTCDLSQSNLCEVDFGAGNTTLAFANPHGSGPYWLRSCQDSVGGRTYTFAGAMKGFVQPDPAAGTSNCTEQPFTFDGTNYQGGTSAVPTSAWHGVSAPEGSAPTATSGSDIIYGDSAAHRFKMTNNGGTAVQVVGSGADINTSDQVTSTHLSAGLPRAQGGLNSASPGTGILRDGTTPTASELSGDATTSGSNSVTVAKVNGTSVPTNSVADQFLGTTASATGAWASMPNCGDSSHALAYNTSTHAFSCQSVTGGTSSPPNFPVNPQTTTYTATAADFTNCKVISVASGTFTVTLVASGSQPSNGQCVWVVNYGSGVVTLARNGQNINGAAANLTLPAGSASAPTGAFVVSDGTNYFTQPFGSGVTATVQHAIPFVIDGGGSAITTGALKDFPTAAFSCTINRIDISADQAGSITIDIWKAAGAIPTSANKISASAPLTLSSAQLNQNGSLTGWTTSVSVGDVFGFNVATASTVTHVVGQIWCQ